MDEQADEMMTWYTPIEWERKERERKERKGKERRQIENKSEWCNDISEINHSL